MTKLTIAIDGPAGAGKSTVAQIVAKRLEYTYIDTGAMYRAVTWAVQNRAIHVEDAEAVGKLAEQVKIRLANRQGKTQVFVDGEDITDAIRTPEISRMVSAVACIPRVRQAMLLSQRDMARAGGVVMDGRDIGSYVLPGADVKIFLTASIEERARRRWREMTEKGFAVDLAKLQEEIMARDKMDSERETAPLVQTEDAVLVDTTGMSIDEVAEKILLICRERLNLV